MLTPFEQLEAQISRTDQQLLYYLILEQKETNRLLRSMTENKQGSPEPIETVLKRPDEFSSLKRAELMKKLAGISNKPQGWNLWSNEKMLEHLREVS